MFTPISFVGAEWVLLSLARISCMKDSMKVHCSGSSLNQCDNLIKWMCDDGILCFKIGRRARSPGVRCT